LTADSYKKRCFAVNALPDKVASTLAWDNSCDGFAVKMRLSGVERCAQEKKVTVLQSAQFVVAFLYFLLSTLL
jgi:hypothetical protein